MILCKYEKKAAAVYTPHLDLMRGIMMAIRRTGLNIRYSDGFNPHPRIYFTQPPPVGAASECEYFAADSPEDPDVFMKKLNTSLQSGVKILKAAADPQNPNFAALSTAAEYNVAFEKNVTLPEFGAVLGAERYEIAYGQKNGAPLVKDVRPLIFDLCGSGKNYTFTLACGNKNLRADRLADHFLASAGYGDIYYTVTKKRLFTQGFTDIDDLYFKGNAR